MFAGFCAYERIFNQFFFENQLGHSSNYSTIESIVDALGMINDDEWLIAGYAWMNSIGFNELKIVIFFSFPRVWLNLFSSNLRNIFKLKKEKQPCYILR